MHLSQEGMERSCWGHRVPLECPQDLAMITWVSPHLGWAGHLWSVKQTMLKASGGPHAFTPSHLRMDLGSSEPTPPHTMKGHPPRLPSRPVRNLGCPLPSPPPPCPPTIEEGKWKDSGTSIITASPDGPARGKVPLRDLGVLSFSGAGEREGHTTSTPGLLQEGYAQGPQESTSQENKGIFLQEAVGWVAGVVSLDRTCGWRHESSFVYSQTGGLNKVGSVLEGVWSATRSNTIAPVGQIWATIQRKAEALRQTDGRTDSRTEVGHIGRNSGCFLH